jgi:hypothetical protein
MVMEAVIVRTASSVAAHRPKDQIIGKYEHFIELHPSQRMLVPRKRACAVLTKRVSHVEQTGKAPQGISKVQQAHKPDSSRTRMLTESDMFARAVVIKVQSGCEIELTRTFEQEVIPRFRKEKDFRGLPAFTVPDGSEALSLRLWDQQERRRGFWARSFCASMALAKVALGKPSVQVCEVGNPPLHAPGQVSEQGEGIEAMADLEIYR